ncbi:conserved hypothetical protein [Talaromyces marneffei ATCC 18224]|uniref:Tc1-like transposase DDE domain-containing protein n=1 Tax=Talaromyces marneffei (strain ATCC 18224 / CBS 334.59 / QM 7333) TaxID=441960 RepID=B6QSA4_TALMQ|nr:conserved hypothetical protein [Talaromyces marneffei ATCC 18224]
MASEEYSVETRAQIVALVMIAKMKPQDVAILLNIPRVSVYQIVQRAKEHGYDPTVNPRIEHEHVANNTRSGRPKVVTEAIEASIIASITKDRAGREKSAEYLAYEAENAAAKKKAEKELQIINRHREQAAREEWELNNTFSRLQLRPRGGRKPKFKFTTKNGKLVRKGTDGIDWYRYQKEILVPKLLPFAQECKRSRPGTIVMEDNAPAHAHFHQKEIYSFHDVQRLLWPGNSPDLNAVEPTWFWLKKRTTLQGAPGDRKTAVEAWQKAWERLPQHRIQAWIERIPFHIQEIIRLEGGNEYPEGRPQGDVRSRCRRKGVLSFRAYLEDEWEDLE